VTSYIIKKSKQSDQFNWQFHIGLPVSGLRINVMTPLTQQFTDKPNHVQSFRDWSTCKLVN